MKLCLYLREYKAVISLIHCNIIVFSQEKQRVPLVYSSFIILLLKTAKVVSSAILYSSLLLSLVFPSNFLRWPPPLSLSLFLSHTLPSVALSPTPFPWHLWSLPFFPVNLKRHPMLLADPLPGQDSSLQTVHSFWVQGGALRDCLDICKHRPDLRKRLHLQETSN